MMEHEGGRTSRILSTNYHQPDSFAVLGLTFPWT